MLWHRTRNVLRKRDKSRLSAIAGSKYFILGLLFMLTAVATFVSMEFEQKIPSATTMSSASLPTVCMKTDEGMEYNLLYGFTTDIDATLNYGNLTLVNQSKKLQVKIHTYNENVTNIAYKIRDLKNNSLIENTQIDDFTVSDGDIDAVFNIKNLIDSNVEYALQIVLTTDKHEEINYYTRIITGGNYDIQSKFDFVLDFNACTFDEDRLPEIKEYLETSKAGDNSNYGSVNINSSLSQVGWGDLKPYVESAIIPTLIAVKDDVALISLNYRIGAPNAYASNDSYNVNEFYRIRKTNNGFYLLNYEREASQIFDAKNDLTSSSKINLGINADSNVEVKASEDGNYTYFVNQGSLWCYNNISQTFTRVFSFAAEDGDSVRENNLAHRIDIIEVDNANVTFSVTGYMNRGEHEGKVGVSLCEYQYDINDVVERLFIPFDMPYEFILENVGQVCYVNGDKFYVLIDETLFSVDLISKEIMTEVDNLKEGTYVVSEAGDAIAYSMSGDKYNNSKIRILNMSKGTDKIIEADEGDTLMPLGYIQSDCIYGTAHKSDLLFREDGSSVFAMYKLGIMDEDYNIIKSYEEAGIYVSDAIVEGMRVTLSRLIKDEDGYSTTTIDQLINKNENVSVNEVYTETIATESRKQELFIGLMTKINDLSVTFRTAGSVVYKDDTLLELEDEFTWNGRYYIYGEGRFIGSETRLEIAIDKAFDTFGDVINSEAKQMWTRVKSTEYYIEGLESSGTSEENSLVYSVAMLCAYAGGDISVSEYMAAGHNAVETLSQISGITGINLSGITMEKALSYVGKGYPVIARTGADTYVVITGYSSKEVTYVDVAAGKTVSVQQADANKLFSAGGNIYVTYIK